MRRVVTLLILASLFVVGCTAGVPATEAPLDPHTLLTQAVANLRPKQTFRVIVERSGADYLFQTDLGEVVFQRAEGQYVSPDTIGAKVKIELGNLPVEADVYAKGENQSVRGLWTSMQWQAGVFAPGFDPSKIVSQEQSGLDQAVNALVDPQLAGEEAFEDGTTVYHITATANGADVAAMVVNLIQMTGTVNVDVYLAKDTGLPVRFVIVQPDSVTAEQTKPTKWTIDLFDFDAKSEVEIPA
ncbi:MAG: LppX_LprAFG lipoprotein [Anaerolineae bacterium]|nr:LppX_LprAFG lipoprotein [Anaerolineae bacterium]